MQRGKNVTVSAILKLRLEAVRPTRSLASHQEAAVRTDAPSCQISSKSGMRVAD